MTLNDDRPNGIPNRIHTLVDFVRKTIGGLNNSNIDKHACEPEVECGHSEK